MWRGAILATLCDSPKTVLGRLNGLLVIGHFALLYKQACAILKTNLMEKKEMSGRGTSVCLFALPSTVMIYENPDYTDSRMRYGGTGRESLGKLSG